MLRLLTFLATSRSDVEVEASIARMSAARVASTPGGGGSESIGVPVSTQLAVYQESYLDIRGRMNTAGEKEQRVSYSSHVQGFIDYVGLTHGCRTFCLPTAPGNRLTIPRHAMTDMS